MKIEHIGLCVKEPISMANWYVANLGWVIRRTNGTDQKGLAFVSDPAQETMLELFSNGFTPPLDPAAMSPLMLHIAVKSSDPVADLARLVKAGALYVEGDPKPASGDALVLLRDPWGMVIQLARRQVDF